jgi:hypothetical protein
MKTVKQIADDLGVSKQRVDRLFKQCGINAVCQDGQRRLYSPESVAFAASHFTQTASRCGSQTASSTLETALFDAVLKQLETKDRQIEALTAALHAEQQLHADTKKMLPLSNANETERSTPMSRWQRLRRAWKD